MSQDNIAPPLKKIFQQKSVHASLALMTLLVGSALLIFDRVPPEIPLLYSHPWGLTQLAPRYAIYLLAAAGIVVTTLHTTLAIMVSKQEKLLPRLLSWSTVLLLCLLLLALFTVYLRVG